MESPTEPTDVDGTTEMDPRPVFYVCHHDSKRTEVGPQLLQQAQDSGVRIPLNQVSSGVSSHQRQYATLTVPITTPYFNLRVLMLLLDHLEKSSSQTGSQVVPIIPCLSAPDTHLVPGVTLSQQLGVVSPWIDLSSPDPIVFNFSRQVLEMEVAYAAFCGISHLILPSPKLHHGKKHGAGIAQYAHAVRKALDVGSFMKLLITMPMMDNPHDVSEDTKGSLATQARAEYVGPVDKEWQAIHDDVRSSLESRPKELLNVNPRKSVQISSKHDFFGTWDAWNIIRTVCKYNSRLFVALSIPRYLPSASICSRWFSEPLRLIILNQRTFFDNKSGYPVLHKEHRSLINKYMSLQNLPWILLSDVSQIPGEEDPEAIFPTEVRGLHHSNSMETTDNAMFPTPSEANAAQQSKHLDPLHYLNILHRLQQEQAFPTDNERTSTRYRDFLQAPLQPLTDDLESVTYEVFEQDPVKYDLYLEAIKRALIDWRQHKKRASSPTGKIVVAVVGAGRGPLVTRALQASEVTGIPIETWALEKNPNAFVLLERHNKDLWKNQVQLVRSDMRAWKGPNRPPPSHPLHPSGTTTPQMPQEHYPIDILISELLGSFADNELSPECLDGILPLLNPANGISIPQSYTAFLTPISAPTLHASILARTHTDEEAPNTPYVVLLHAVDYLSTTAAPAPTPSSSSSSSTTVTTPLPTHILPAWSFQHNRNPPPYPQDNSHNARQARLDFPLKDRSVCHGLAGYFEAVLYPGVELSTHPHTMETKSPLMMSWFPIFFPLKTPLYTPDKSHLTVSIFRQTDARKVWYEWMVESWMELPVSTHDPRGNMDFIRSGTAADSAGGEGRRIRLGVSEVGSSKERGCMM